MTKEAAVAEAVAASAAVANKPFSIRLLGPAPIVLNALAVHVRSGYIVNTDAPFQLMPNGFCEIYLVQGTPNEIAVNRAKEDVEQAVALEQAQYRKDVAGAAKQMIEAEKRAALEKQVAEAVAKHDAEIAKLKRESEAELRKLQQATAAEMAKLKQ